VLVDDLRKQANSNTFGAGHLGNLPANTASEQKMVLYLETSSLSRRV
jgi:hypothetical protein